MDGLGIAVGTMMLTVGVAEAVSIVWTKGRRWLVMQGCGNAMMGLMFLVSSVFGDGPIQLALVIVFGLAMAWFYFLMIKWIKNSPDAPGQVR